MMNRPECRYWRREFGKLLLGRLPTGKECALFSRCKRMAELADREKVPCICHAKKKRRVLMTPLGRKKSMQVVRDQLFEWFTRVRGTVKGRFPRDQVVMKAQSLKVQYVASCLQHNAMPDTCQIRGRWIREWLKEHHVT